MSASRLLYGTTVFLGAFLLFLVEPMAGKQLLPTLGGSSAVWLTCLVFFQVTLLLGYLYAHWITRCRASDWRQHVYLVTLGAAVVLLVAQGSFPRYWAKARTILSRPSSSRSVHHRTAFSAARCNQPPAADVVSPHRRRQHSVPPLCPVEYGIAPCADRVPSSSNLT